MSAITDLRESLREAARRDIEAERVRARRVRRRGTAFLAAVLLGGAAAATAADLISVGEPVKDTREEMAQYRAAKGGEMTFVLIAPSGGRVPFGVANYVAANGQRCAIAGHARGSAIGVVVGNSFRPYDPSKLGICGRRNQLFHSAIDIGDRTLLVGRAKAGARTVTFEGRTQPVGDGGTFLFVLKRVPATYKFVVE